MRTYTDAWTAQTSGIKVVRVDDSVLDQLLCGRAEVLWEIQELQDRELLVETTAPQPDNNTPDIEELRAAIRADSDLPVARLRALPLRQDRVALWSFLGSPSQRAAVAEAAGADLYEPDLAPREPTAVVTAAAALDNGRRIGAINPTTHVQLNNAAGLLSHTRGRR